MHWRKASTAATAAALTVEATEATEAASGVRWRLWRRKVEEKVHDAGVESWRAIQAAELSPAVLALLELLACTLCSSESPLLSTFSPDNGAGCRDLRRFVAAGLTTGTVTRRWPCWRW